jgi:hypothetical protein
MMNLRICVVTALAAIPGIAIAPDIILEIVITLDVILEIAITGLDPASDFLGSSLHSQRLVTGELAADFLDPAFCLFDSTLELIPVHDCLLRRISGIYGTFNHWFSGFDG